MRESRVDDLVQRELDGILSETEAAELRATTGADPGLSAERAMMQQIGAALDALPVAEPPVGFAAAIMTRVRGQRASRRATVLPFRTRRRTVAAMAIAATALIGVLFVPYIAERMGESEFTGAMVPSESSAFELAVPGRTGAITLAAAGRTLELRFALDARADDRVVLLYDESLLGPAEVKAAATIQRAPGALTIQPGGGSAAIHFARESPRASAIEVSYHSNERLLVRRTIEIPAITNF